MCYLLTYIGATTELSTCPPLPVLASCCVLHPQLCTLARLPEQGNSCLCALNMLLISQSLAIKKTTSNGFICGQDGVSFIYIISVLKLGLISFFLFFFSSAADS